MKRVTGIGGIFFKAKNPVALRAWHQKHLEYGKFGWVIDPEGNKIELWEPPPGQ